MRTIDSDFTNQLVQMNKFNFKKTRIFGVMRKQSMCKLHRQIGRKTLSHLLVLPSVQSA